MLILENLENNKKIALSDSDLDVIYDALREQLDNEDNELQVIDILDKISNL